MMITLACPLNRKTQKIEPKKADSKNVEPTVAPIEPEKNFR